MSDDTYLLLNHNTTDMPLPAIKSNPFDLNFSGDQQSFPAFPRRFAMICLWAGLAGEGAFRKAAGLYQGFRNRRLASKVFWGGVSNQSLIISRILRTFASFSASVPSTAAGSGKLRQSGCGRCCAGRSPGSISCRAWFARSLAAGSQGIQALRRTCRKGLHVGNFAQEC